jgi:hypothetical protein
MHFDDLHIDHNDRSVRWTLGLWVLVLGILLFKCNPQQIKALESGALSAAECGVHASTACSAQAAIRCGKRGEADTWGDYGQCLADHAGGCISSGLAKCAAASLVKITGDLFGAGSSGCKPEEARESVRACIKARAPHSEREAVHVVASCFVDVCERD